MNAIRKSLGLVMLLILAAFALPVLAASSSPKFFYAKFPVTIPLGTTNQTFTVFNATPPPGVSTINSMEIDAPAGVTINSIAPGSLLDKGTDSSGRHIYFINNLPGIKSGKSLTFAINVTVSVTSCRRATWGIAANTGNAYPQGDGFVDQNPPDENLTTGLGCDGQVSCDSVEIPFDFQTSDGTTGSGVRGWNKDGSPCNKVDYHFAVDTTNLIGKLQWDTGQQPNAAFSWTVLWPPEDVDSTGWLVRRPKLAWTMDVSGNATNIINGVACLSAIPPTPYGILVNGLNDTDTTSTVTLDTTTTINTQGPPRTAVPTSPPFPIVIGTERMQVTAVSGGPTYTLTVTRATGGTIKASHAASTGTTQTIVMSTPLPIDPNPQLADGTSPNPYYLQQDHMCVWDQGWTASGINPQTGVQQVRSSVSVFDVGDGFVFGR